MRKLYIIRHAKSSWSDDTVSDFNRQLNKRGMRDAPFMAERLARMGASPDIIISSPAKRAKKTAEFMALGVGYEENLISYNDLVYSSSLADLYQVLRKIDDNCVEAYLVGHNFAITELAEELTGKSLINIPTSGVVALECVVKSWREIVPGCCSLLFFDYPKKHQECQ
jgi:phosphohistidine phosphatase